MLTRRSSPRPADFIGTEAAVTPEVFLRGIFDRAIEGYVSIWAKGEKRARWLRASQIENISVPVQKDLYFGCGIYGQPVTHGRGKAENVIAIPGVWADVDYIDGKHDAKKRYPSRAVALEAIMSMPLRPTVIVESGGGFQPWWLTESIVPSMENAAGIVAGWQRLIKEKLSRNGGWEMDSTHDLARVLRPAGTRNWKYGGVEVIIANGFGPPDEWGYIPNEMLFEIVGPVQSPERHEYVLDEIKIDGDANADNDLFKALINNSPQFSRTWEHKRPMNDTSPSAWELSLASQAAQAGWSDQEIANLIFAHRRKYSPDTLDKATRESYLRLTIGKARGDSEYLAAKIRLCGEATEEESQKADGGGDPADERKRLLKDISIMLGRIPIADIQQFGREHAIWSLILDGGEEIVIGSTGALRGFDQVAGAILEQCHVSVRRLKRCEWDRTLSNIAQAATLIESKDTTPTAELMEHVRSFTARSMDEIDPKRKPLVCDRKQPFVEDGELHVNRGGLSDYLRLHGCKYNLRQLSKLLTQAGFVHHQVRYQIAGQWGKKWYWKIAVSLLEEPDE